MNIRYRDNQLVSAEILEPTRVVATFSDELTERAKQTLAAEIVSGMDLLMIYQKYQRHGDVDSIRDIRYMLDEMARIFSIHEAKLDDIRRNT